MEAQPPIGGQASDEEAIRTLFEQVEGQVQFGDTKASLLIASDSILIAVAGGVIKAVSGCSKEFALDCVRGSSPLWTASIAALLLVSGLCCALLAALPSRIHWRPPPQLFLVSHIASSTLERFETTLTSAALRTEALTTIHGKARYATHKFKLLYVAICATIGGLAVLVAAVAVGFGPAMLTP